MNVFELLADLQARHDETTARAGELRSQVEHLTAALPETAGARSSRAPAPPAVGHPRFLPPTAGRWGQRPGPRARSDL
ncbi:MULTISPECIES: hypothetical protein [unclassified Streptomyces]|uniref:hypothetical protein n=1 Tax=unclassified Streptomyces TaxID=2593676 RepID=UPI001654E6CC|nr:hypothetical protein [Streptomyces sp. CB02980]MCB8905538.1 hypothetical protein [Streptomyces sp. CB02980]